jgi:hypothetical protein
MTLSHAVILSGVGVRKAKANAVEGPPAKLAVSEGR